MGEEVLQDTLSARDVIQIRRPHAHRRDGGGEAPGVRPQGTEDVARHYKKILQCRQKLHGHSARHEAEAVPPAAVGTWAADGAHVAPVPRDQVSVAGHPPSDRPIARRGGRTAAARERLSPRRSASWRPGPARAPKASRICARSSALRPAAAADGRAVRRLGGGTRGARSRSSRRRTTKPRRPRRS